LLINLHHHPELVESYLRKLANDSLKLVVFREKQLLGSGGTIAANADFIRQERDFYVLYADNLTNVNLESLLEYHRANDGVLTMGLFHTRTPDQCGIVELDSRRGERPLASACRVAALNFALGLTLGRDAPRISA